MYEQFRLMQRQPRRVSITISYQVHETLLARSEQEGRSLSNLCAFLLEESLHQQGSLGPAVPSAPILQAPTTVPAVRPHVLGNGFRP